MGLCFAFDPGLASLGLAVTSAGGGQPTILAAASGIALPCLPRETHSARLRRRRTRQLARRKARRRAFATLLRSHGLLPETRDDALFASDPWALRNLAATEPLDAHALGRLLMHLHARRGVNDESGTAVQPATMGGEGRRQRTRHTGRGAAALRNRAHLAAGAHRITLRAEVLGDLDTLLAAQSRQHGALSGGTLAETIRAHFREATARHGRHPPRRPERALDPLRRLLLAAMDDLERRFGTPDDIVIEGPVPARPADAVNLSRQALAARQARAADGTPLCPYTGTELTPALLASRLTETDHVVPLSSGGSNDPDNLVVCMATANRAKGARTPNQAFGQTEAWQAIADRSRALPETLAAAILGETGPQVGAPSDPAQMVRAHRMCRSLIARRWPQAALRTLPAAQVAALRRHLLEQTGDAIFSKDRRDNRNHGIDAMLAALTSQPALPDDGVILEAARTTAVIHETRRARAGRCMEETVYGPVKGSGQKGGLQVVPGLAVHRKPLAALSRSEARFVRDPDLRIMLQREATLSRTPSAWQKAMTEVSGRTGTFRVRLLKNLSCARLSRDGSRMLVPSGNHHVDIIAGRDGAWQACGVTLADAALPGYRPEWERDRRGAKLVMRLHRGDMLELDDDDGNRCLRTVRRIGASNGYLYLAAPVEGGSLQARHADAGDAFRWDLASAENLRQRRARALDISPSGTRRWRRSNVGNWRDEKAGGPR